MFKFDPFYQIFLTYKNQNTALEIMCGVFLFENLFNLVVFFLKKAYNMNVEVIDQQTLAHDVVVLGNALLPLSSCQVKKFGTIA